MPATSGGRAAKLSDEQQREAEEAQTAGPYQMATGMGVDDVIDPRDLIYLLSAMLVFLFANVVVIDMKKGG